MRILLAIDGSAHSAPSVHEITRQHLPAGSEVRVISVVEPNFPVYSEGAVSLVSYEELDKMARERARTAVDQAAAEFSADAVGRQLTVTTEVLSGSPKSKILEAADAFGADLIVVGSHGHGMLERFLLGSVAQAVALHATCSVEIVRSPKPRASN